MEARAAVPSSATASGTSGPPNAFQDKVFAIFQLVQHREMTRLFRASQWRSGCPTWSRRKVCILRRRRCTGIDPGHFQPLRTPYEHLWVQEGWTRWCVPRRSTRCPRSLSILQIQTSKGEVIITNDGATILKSIQALHPAAKMVRGTR